MNKQNFNPYKLQRFNNIIIILVEYSYDKTLTTKYKLCFETIFSNVIEKGAILFQQNYFYTGQV